MQLGTAVILTQPARGELHRDHPARTLGTDTVTAAPPLTKLADMLTMVANGPRGGVMLLNGTGKLARGSALVDHISNDDKT